MALRMHFHLAFAQRQQGAHDDAHEMLGLQAWVIGNGFFTFRGIAVDYRVGDHEYRDVYPFALHVCAPELRYASTCSAPPLSG